MLMGDPEADWCVPAVQGLTREAGIGLLDRAAEIGLLTSHGDGYYDIHPALPWFFKSLFEKHFLESETTDTQYAASSPLHLRATRAFVEAMGLLGSVYHNKYQAGNRKVIAALSAEEANLLHAHHLAHTHDWLESVLSTMQGLRILFGQTGRRAEWSHLVDEIVPDFVDLDTDGPLPGREEQWSLVTAYRVQLAREVQQWAEAERFQRVCVHRDRQTAEDVVGPRSERTTLVKWLKTVDPNLDNAQRNAIRTLAISLQGLGHIYRELNKADCVVAFEESLALFERIGERAGAARSALAIGQAYKDIDAMRALADAEYWLRHSLKMRPEHDRQGQAISLRELGGVALSRFWEARDANAPEAELLRHLNTALQFYSQTLWEFPQHGVDELAVAHHVLGRIYAEYSDVDRALGHFCKSIRYHEKAGNLYKGTGTRYDVALVLAASGRLASALEYARDALRNFETFGDDAAQDIEQTQQLITRIEQDVQKG